MTPTTQSLARIITKRARVFAACSIDAQDVADPAAYLSLACYGIADVRSPGLAYSSRFVRLPVWSN